MPLIHCNECCHEWETSDVKSLCDWCGSDGFILKDKTDLETFLEQTDFFEESDEKDMLKDFISDVIKED